MSYKVYGGLTLGTAVLAAVVRMATDNSETDVLFVLPGTLATMGAIYAGIEADKAARRMARLAHRVGAHIHIG